MGAGYLISTYLQNLENNNQVRKDLIDYAKAGNDLLSYPYILSGYCLISYANLLTEGNINNFASKIVNKKEIKGITFSCDNYINTSKSLTSNGYKNLNKNNYLYAASTYDAYLNFINKKAISLLGTARDVARCKNREKNGNLSFCNYQYLTGYTDLIQYVGVVKNIEKIKKNYATDFAKFLTLPSSQQDLKNYGLFSGLQRGVNDFNFINDKDERFIISVCPLE